MSDEHNRIGSMIGAYRVVSLLGRGGMGAVYEAVHSVIGRKVALKTVRAEMAEQPEFVQRFFNEARAVNLIRNRHIVDIFDVGMTEDRMVYSVMELLVGESLADLLK